jgi:outer membrane murein-binding lipoprotein Lpp
MKRRRPPYPSRRAVWLVIAALATILVLGGVAAGYEINHLRTQVDGLGTQVHELQSQVAVIYQLLFKTIQGGK